MRQRFNDVYKDTCLYAIGFNCETRIEKPYRRILIVSSYCYCARFKFGIFLTTDIR